MHCGLIMVPIVIVLCMDSNIMRTYNVSIIIVIIILFLLLTISVV